MDVNCLQSIYFLSHKLWYTNIVFESPRQAVRYRLLFWEADFIRIYAAIRALACSYNGYREGKVFFSSFGFCGDPDRRADECTYVEGLGFADPALGRPQRNAIRIYGNAIGYAVILFLLLQNLAPYAVVWVLRLLYPAIRVYRGSFLASEENIQLIQFLSSIVCYLLPVVLLRRVLGLSAAAAFPARRLSAETALPLAGIVLGSSAIGSTVSLLLSSLLSLFRLYPSGPQLSTPHSLRAFLGMALTTAVLPAVFEELLFRGVILQSLRRFGDLFALCVSSVIFSLLHRNLVQLPNALLTGMVLGYIVLRTRSVWASIFCHFVNNLFPVILQTLSPYLSDGAFNLLFLGLNFLYVLLGLGGLVYLSVTHGGFFAPLRGEGRHAERYKYRSFFSSLPILVVTVSLGFSILLNLLG